MLMSVRLACQTISWGDDQDQRFPQVFAEIAAAGFEGVEIGFRRLAKTAPAEMKRVLAEYGLSLVASHVGGNLADPDQAEGERGMLDTVLDYLNEMGASLLMYSGLRATDADQLCRDVEMLCTAAEKCAARNVQLLYHNHNWEFHNDGLVINAVFAAPSLGFCPDVGWVYKGGVDVVETLNRMGARVGAAHFKDFASLEQGVDTVPLGAGVVPLEAAARWLQDNVSGTFWVIAEQDRTDIATAEMAKLNGAFLHKAFGA